MNEIYKKLIDQKKNIDSHLANALKELESDKGIGSTIQEEYSQTVGLLEDMIDRFYELHQNTPLYERLKKKSDDIVEGSADIVKKLELLTDFEYLQTPLMEEEAAKFVERVTRISSKLRDPKSSVVTEDIQTLRDISEFILKRSDKMMEDYSGSKQSPAKKPAAKKGSTKTKLTLGELSDMTQDGVYKLFAGKKIFSPLKGSEEDNSSFMNVARAYQHTNEPMHMLFKDLHLDQHGKTVLAITCSGDPVGFFAGLGAEKMICFDTSYRATLYGEFKSACIRALSYRQYRDFFDISDEDSGEKSQSASKGMASYSKDIAPLLSTAAKNSFDALFKSSGSDNSAHAVLRNYKFFRDWGFASPVPESNLFSQSQEHYDTAQNMLKDNYPIFIPGGLDNYMKKVSSEGSFDTVYVSNAPDHFRDSKGNINPNAEVLMPFYTMLDGMLKGTGSKMIFNFQWGYRAVEGSQEALATLGYDLLLTEEDHNHGCGKMAIAEKIK